MKCAFSLYCYLALRRLLLPLACALAIPGQVRAQTLYWDTNNSDAGSSNIRQTWSESPTEQLFWSTSADGTTTPGAWAPGATGVFSAGTNATGSLFIDIIPALRVGAIVVEEGAVEFNGGFFSGSLLNLGAISVAPGASAILNATLTGTANFSKTGAGPLTIAAPNTMTGSMTFSGGTTSITGVANLASGTLNVDSGATLANTGILELNSRTVNVTGAGSLFSATGFIELGDIGNTTLNLTNSGAMTSGSSVALGLSGGVSGAANVSGSGARLAAATDLFLGFSGTGNLTVASGGRVEVGTVLRLATNPGSSATVNLNAGGTLAVGGTDGIRVGSGSSVFTISDGTLEVTGSALTTSVPMSLAGFGSRVDTNGLAATLAGTLSGSGGLEKAGAGTLTLPVANSYTGGTAVIGGTLAMGHVNALGSGGLIVTGGTLDLGGFSPTFGSAILTGGSLANGSLNAGAIEVQLGSAAVPLGGSGALTKTSNSTFTLSGNNTYTGGTIVNAGTLVLAHPNALGAAGADLTLNGGILDLGGHSPSVGRVSYNGGTVINGSLNATGDVTFNSSGSDTFAGVISGSASVTVSSGSLTLSGDNSHTGGTTLFGGTLVLGHPNALGSGPVVLNGGTLDLGGHTISVTSFVLNGGGVTNGTLNAATPVTLAAGIVSATISGTGSLLKTGTGTLTLTGNNTYTGGTTVSGGTLQIGNGGASGAIVGDVLNQGTVVFHRSGSTSFSGVISGTGNVTVEQGTVSMPQAQTYTGATTIKDGGILILSTTLDQGLSPSTVVTVEAGAIFDFSNSILTIADLTGEGTVYSFIPGGQTADGRLTISLASGHSTFAGTLGGAYPNFGVTKAGEGTWVLTGSNTYTGGSNVAGGTLQIGNGGLNGWLIGDITTESNVTFSRADDVTFSGRISGTGSLTKDGPSTLTLARLPNHTGATIITAGQLVLARGFVRTHVYTNSARIPITSNWDDTADITIADVAGVLTKVSVTVHGYSHPRPGNTEIRLETPSSSGFLLATDGYDAVSNLTLTFDDDAPSFAPEFGQLSSGTYRPYSFPSPLGGAVGVNPNGNWRLLVIQANFEPLGIGEIANGWSLFIEAEELDFSVPGDFINHGVINFSRGNEVSVPGSISGTGSVAIDGPSFLTLLGTNTFTGGTTIAGGTLRIGNGGTSGTISGNIANGGNVTFNRSDASSFFGVISGSGGVTKLGSGTLTLHSINSFTGGLTVSGGAISSPGFANPGESAFGTGFIEVLTGASLAGSAHLRFDQPTSVRGAGAGLSTTTFLEVGTGSDGSLAIAEGAVVASGSSTAFGVFGGVTGSGTIAGAGSLLDVSSFLLLGVSGTGTITIADGGALSAESITLGFSATGSGTLHLNTGGTLEIGGTNGLNVGSGAGVVNFGGGTLRVTGSALTANAPFSPQSGTTSTIDTNGLAATFAGAISGSGNLTKDGAGVLTLAGNNTLTGTITVNAGTLRLGSPTALGSATSVVLAAGTILDLNGYPLPAVAISGAGTITSGSGTVTFDVAGSLTVAETVAGTVAVVKSGAGTLTLSGSNTYTGGTTISGGTLAITSDANLGAATGPLAIRTGGVLSAAGNFFTERAITIDGSGSLLSNNGNLIIGNLGNGSLALTNGGAVSGFELFAGYEPGSSGTISIGADCLLNSSNSTNLGRFGGASGQITVAGANARLVSGNSVVVGDGGQGTLTVADGGSVSSPVVLLGSFATGQGTLNLATGGTLATGFLDRGNGSATFNFAGGTLLATSPFTSALPSALTNAPTVDTGSHAVTLAGTFSGNGSLTKQGAGVLTLAADHTFTGGTTVTAGTLQLGNGGSTGSVSGNIANGGNVIFNRSDAFAFVGVISGGGSVTKLGSGTLTLPSINSFTGGLTVSGGAISSPGFANPGESAFGTGTVEVLAGASIAGSAHLRFDQPTSVHGVGAGLTTTTFLEVGTGSDGSLAILEGAVAASGSSTAFGVFGGVTGSGTIAGSGSLLDVSSFLLLGVSGTGNIAVADGGALSAESITLGFSASGSGTLHLNTGGTLEIGGTNGLNVGSGAGVVNFGGGTLRVTGSALTANAPFSLQSGTTSTIDTNGFSATLSGAISGNGNLTKDGAGVLTLAGNNTLTGVITVSAGTLRLGSPTALGAATSVVLAAGAVLDLNGYPLPFGLLSGAGGVIGGTGDVIVDTATSQTISVALSGAVGLRKEGLGTLILTADNGYTGGTTVTAGILQLGNGGSTGSVPGNIVNDGNVTFNRSDDYTFAGLISGAGSMTQQGPGKLTFTANHTYTGGTTVSAGTLQLGNGGSTGSVLGNITNHGHVAFRRSGSYTFPGVISGSGGMTVASGVVALAQPQTYTGPTAIHTGAYLILPTTLDQGLSAATTVDVAAGGNFDISNSTLTLSGLTGSGTVYSFVPEGQSPDGMLTIDLASGSATFAGTLGGAYSKFAVTKDGAGTLTLTAANTYTGGTTLAEGTLLAANPTGSAFGSGSVAVTGGTLGGSGNFTGPLALLAGGTVSPGTSPGTLTSGSTTFAGGASFVFEINDTTGSTGSNWDVLAVNGTLTVNATAATPFTVALISLDGSNQPGTAANFAPGSAYAFPLVTTTGGVSFGPGASASSSFVVDASAFTNTFDGTWAVAVQGNNLVLIYSPNPDTDHDGLDDAWEFAYFGSLDSTDGTGDADHDGQTDAEEYAAGTDPWDSADYFRILSQTILAGMTQITLEFTSNESRWYRIEYTDQLEGDIWTDSPLGVFAPDAGVSTTRSFTLPTSASIRFFRVIAATPHGLP